MCNCYIRIRAHEEGIYIIHKRIRLQLYWLHWYNWCTFTSTIIMLAKLMSYVILSQNLYENPSSTSSKQDQNYQRHFDLARECYTSIQPTINPMSKSTNVSLSINFYIDRMLILFLLSYYLNLFCQLLVLRIPVLGLYSL